ncbi:MAG TPA: tetratricopeptide repeat protein, partial [Candidatus Limnocylindria bacterium]|nr:tetratricopeptide repeat protein [Candidatus Limnocylindria bacterium]
VADRHGFLMHAWRLAWALGPYLDRRGQWRDNVRIGQLGLAAALAVGDEPAAANLHRMMGMAYTGVGDFGGAERHYCEAAALYRRLGDEIGEGYALINSGGVSQQQGDFAVALDRVEAGRAVFKRAGFAPGVRRSGILIGYLAAKLGDHERSLAFCEEALADEALSDLERGSVLSSKGTALRHLGEHRRAVEAYRAGIALVSRVGHDRYEADVQRGLGHSLHQLGEIEGARAAWQRALDLNSDMQETDAIRAELLELLAGIPVS